MRKPVLAIAAVASVFALTSAGAIGYDLTASSTDLSISSSDSVTVVTAGCPLTKLVAISYTVVADVITEVKLDALDATSSGTTDATCDATVDVTLNGNVVSTGLALDPSVAANDTFVDGLVTIAISPGYNLDLNTLTSVDVVINAPVV